MTTQFNINRYIQGVNGFGLQFPDDSYTATLAASTAESVTVPPGGVTGSSARIASPDGSVVQAGKNRYVAIFKYTHATTADFWVAVGSNPTASVPAGGTFAASTSILNPEALSVKAGDGISIISTAGGVVNVQFYGIQN